MRTPSIALCFAFTLACTDGGGEAPIVVPDAAADGGAVDAAADVGAVDAGSDATPGPDMARPSGPLAVAFADAEDDWFIAEDGRVPYVWGFQGGTMIRPLIVVDHPDFVAGQDVFVQIEHGPDPDAPETFAVEPDFERLTLELPLEQTRYGLTVGPLDDQLGWDGLDGVRLRMTATVEGLDATWSRSLSLYLDEADPHPCDSISEPSELEGDPCRIAVIRGDVLINSVEPGAGTCDEPSMLIGDGPDGAVPGATCPGRLGVVPEWYTAVAIEAAPNRPRLTAACAADLGIVPGARLPGALRVRFGLGCDPEPRVTIDVDTAGCPCR